MDWSPFGCARTGHVTYASDEPELRDRLMAPAVGRTAWRCLRCGAFVTGEPHCSGPAAAAPLLRCGKELRSELILRAFAVDRFLRFLILGAAAYGVWRFKYDRAGLQRAFNNALPAIRALYQDLGFNVSHSKLLPFIQHSFTHTSRWLTLVAIGLAVYALIELVEGAGLWLGRRWGEYFALVVTSIFLPYEVYDLVAAKVTWLRVAALVINLLLVIYLAWTKRLFGIRGAKKAYEARLLTESVIEVEQATLAAMKKLLPLMVGTLAALLLSNSLASASTLPDCLAQQHVCVTSNGRTLISEGQQAQLEQQIGGDDIYLVVAASGTAGYNSAMDQIISALSGHQQFTVGFMDSRLRHFGAYSKGMLPSHGAADIAATVVQQHQADQDIFAALTDFVNSVQQESGSGPGGAAPSAPSHVLLNVLIAVSIVFVVVMLGFFLIARPIRKRRQRELKEAKSAAQDDLIALSAGVTDHHADVSIQTNPEAAGEQGAALSAYERRTAALDAAKRATDMGAVSRAIAEGQYHLACAEALAAGEPRPDRRPSCFFDPRHGMSVSDVHWTPADGGLSRSVPACSACAHKVGHGLEPDMRKVETHGALSSYLDAGFAPAYWGGYGFAPGIFTGFLLGQALAPEPSFSDRFSFGGGDFGGGGGGFA